MIEKVHHETPYWSRSKVIAAFLIQFAIALSAFLIPQRQVPLDYRGMLWVSLPLCVIWLALVAALSLRLKWKTLWMLIGTPLVLYWPIWLLFHQIPSCYWQHNCV